MGFRFGQKKKTKRFCLVRSRTAGIPIENRDNENSMTQNEKDFSYSRWKQTWEEMQRLENLNEQVPALTLTSIIADLVVQQKFTPETDYIL